MTIGSLFALQFKKKHRKASEIHRHHNRKHTHTHTHVRAHIAPPTSQLPWSHPTWRTHICNSHWQSSTWHLDSPLLSISKADIEERRWYMITNKHKQTMTKCTLRPSLDALLEHSHSYTHTHTHTHTHPRESQYKKPQFNNYKLSSNTSFLVTILFPWAHL